MYVCVSLLFFFLPPKLGCNTRGFGPLRRLCRSGSPLRSNGFKGSHNTDSSLHERSGGSTGPGSPAVYIRNNGWYSKYYMVLVFRKLGKELSTRAG